MKYLLLLLISLYSLKGFSQDSLSYSDKIPMDKLSPHIYTAKTLQKGILQLEGDFVFSAMDTPEGSSLNFYYNDVKVRYGLTDFIEARLGRQSFFGSNNLKGLGFSNTEARQHFVNFVNLGVKASLLHYNNKKGLLAVAGESYLPLLGKEIQGPAVIGSFSLINENRFNKWLGYTLNAGSTFSRTDQVPSRLDLGGVLNFYHSSRFSSFLGLNSFYFPSGWDSARFVNAGMLYAVSSDMQLRTSFILNMEGPEGRDAIVEGILALAWQPSFFRNK